MADNSNLTIFQRLSRTFRGSGRGSISQDVISSRYGDNPDRVLFSTNDRNEYEKKLNSLRQQKYLAYVWKKAAADNSMESLAGYTAVKLMFRDADLMDGTPEIGAALDIIAEEACPLTSDGRMVNIYSKSKRTKAMLEDLFVNRLHIYTDLPMIARHMTKYGNTYMLLNIDKKEGVLGWTMLPVYEVDRVENGYGSTYGLGDFSGSRDIKPDEVVFVWNGHNESNPYRNWQMAHFRLLNDSFFLPYGVSALHKARRAWRMWSMMEDAMLIWRLDKAVERRVFKIYVGNIDDADVQSYVNEIANNFKRTQIIDPETGQIDLRRNFLDVGSDYFIPTRSENAPNPIETLQAANSQVQMEDIEYMQNKMLTALRVPKTFLNFQEAQGKGQNLSIMDVRFSRMINRIQQFLLMELNKIAMIHLYVMGMTDEINNFTLSLNNPSAQIEAQELEDMTKRLTALNTALSDPGSGIPLLSLHKALRDIMKMSDREIMDMLKEIRYEKAMAAELQNTPNIIKTTGAFDPVDRLYGDYDAMVSGGGAPAQQDNAEGVGAPAGGAAGGAFGGGFDMGEPGTEDEGDMSGGEGEASMADAEAVGEGSPLMETVAGTKKRGVMSFTERYLNMLSESQRLADGEYAEFKSITDKSHIAEEKIARAMKGIDKMMNADDVENARIMDEVENDLD